MPKVNINLEPVKKNGAAIACGVVALAAVVLAFYPLGAKRTELQQQLTTSASAMGQVDGLLHKTRTLPAIDSGEPKPLEKFPNERVIADGNALVQAVGKQSGELLNAAIRLNAHAPLVPGCLPAPSPGRKVQFRDAYLATIATEIQHTVNGGTPPTQQDIERAITDEKNKINDPANGIAIIVNGQVVNPQDVNNKIIERSVAIPREMRNEVASQHKMYMGLGLVQGGQAGAPNTMTDALTVKQEITPTTSPDEVTIWLAQMQLWVQEDVAAGLAEANRSAKDVTDAPVKHLVKITLPPQSPYVLPPGVPSSIDPATPVTLMKSYSPTGRVCCPMYDVVQFSLTLRVRTADLPTVIETLEKDRLITVWQCNINSYDTAAAAAAGYSYGTDPVVEVVLNCEELFLRKWTVPLMPAPVRKFLNIPDQPATPVPAT